MKNLKQFGIFESASSDVMDFIDYINRKKNELRSKGGSNLKPNEVILDLLLKGVKDGEKAGNSQISQIGSYGDNGVELEDLKLQNAVSPVVGKVDFRRMGGNKERNAQIVVDKLKKHGIVNPLTQKAILSVIGKESGFIPKDERSYGNTSNARIRKIFGSRVSSLSDKELNRIKKTDEFWNIVYGGRYGNNSSGDGAKYRGRGFNQTTFKGNYKKYNDLLKRTGFNVDIVNNPEKLNDPEVAAEVNALYFLDRLNTKHSKRKFGNDDPNDFKNFEDALGAAVNANAGWGKNIVGSRAWKSALAYSSNFDIGDYSNLA